MDKKDDIIYQLSVANNTLSSIPPKCYTYTHLYNFFYPFMPYIQPLPSLFSMHRELCRYQFLQNQSVD